MLGLWFIPNWHERRKNKQKDQAAIKSSAGTRGSGRCWLAGAISITGARVEARTGILKKNRKEEAKPDLGT
jgi:hypothetical protein